MKKLTCFALCILILLLLSGQVAAQTGAQHLLEGVQFDELADEGVGINIISSPEADLDLEPGFPVQTILLRGTFMAGPNIHTLVGNIDADPELEILGTGVAQGPLYAWNYDGTPVPGFPVYFYNRTFYPALGNLSDQWPGMEIFAGQFMYRFGTIPPAPLLAYSGAGTMLPGWPRVSEYDVPNPATLVDLDNDGLDEVIVSEPASNYGYKADGTPLPGWPINSSNFSRALGDLDGDGDLEIVTFNNWSNEGADLIAYHHNGDQVDNFLVRFQPSNLLYPVIGDVNGDGSPEIIVLHNGEYDGVNSPMRVLIISSDGKIIHDLPGSLNNGYVWTEPSYAPALADLDHDGIPEIIIGAGGAMIVYKGDGTPFPGWPLIWDTSYRISPGNSAPVVGDVDGDQEPDIVFTNQKGSSDYGDVIVFDNHGNLHPHFPKSLVLVSGAVPAIADIDLDGRNEIIISSCYTGRYAGYYDKVWVYDLGGPQHGKVEWGQLAGGPQHLGYYAPPATTNGTDLYLLARDIVGIQEGSEAILDVVYGNHGSTQATSVTLTATLSASLTYISDTSNIAPTIDGQNIIWHLPHISYPYEQRFTLVVEPPMGTVYGDRFSVLLSMSSKEDDANPSDNSKTIEIMVARSTYLPIVKR